VKIQVTPNLEHFLIAILVVLVVAFPPTMREIGDFYWNTLRFDLYFVGNVVV